MNNYPSTNSGTVIFLVLLFIGMGLLMYHTYEITLENGQLKETVSTLKTSEATLNTEKDSLKAENAILMTENAALMAENLAVTDEINKLETALTEKVTENMALMASDTEKSAELETLRIEYSELLSEYLKLKPLQSDDESAGLSPEAHLSSLLPVGLDYWVILAVGILLAALIFIRYKTLKLLNYMQQKKAGIRSDIYNRLPKNRSSR